MFFTEYNFGIYLELVKYFITATSIRNNKIVFYMDRYSLLMHEA